MTVRRVANIFLAMLLWTATAVVAVAAAPLADEFRLRMRPCEACHGKEGRPAADGYYPRIAGKPAGYLYEQLLNFRDGRRILPIDRKSTRLNSSHIPLSRMPSSA